MALPLKKGEQGPKVKELQKLLVELGYPVEDGMLYTIKGNKSPNVQRFRMCSAGWRS